MHRLAYLRGFALLALLAAAPAFAQSNVDVAQSWGVIGTWRIDCKQPTSRANPDLKYVVRDGKLFHDRNFGDVTDSHPVIVATRRDDGSLELVINFNEYNETRQYAFVHGENNSLRTMYNRNVDTGDSSIRDGVMTASGQPSAWQYRCD